MNIHEFEYHKQHFPYAECAAYWLEHVWKRDDFVNTFSRDKIASMTIDEYVVGYGDKTTFCYGLWVGLKQLANIRSAFPTDFGVYYNKKLKNYVPDQNKWHDPMKAFESMRKSILDLLDAGEKEDLNLLAENPINSMVKGKILSVYYPNRYLSICATNHIDHYMKAYGLYNSSTEYLNPIYKREILSDFKNSDAIMKDWSLDQFAYFMWGVYPLSPRNSRKGSQRA